MHRIQSFTVATALAVACTAASAAFAQAPSQDREFVQKAAASGRMEVEHGKMAASKAANAQVKAFGNALVKDHTAANQQLMAIARRKNITLAAPARAIDNQASPAGGSSTSATSATKSGATRATTSGTTGTTGASGGVKTTGEARDQHAGAGAARHAEPWMTATGNTFDRGFLDAQVKAHQEAIALFEKQASGGGDAELKAFAQKQLSGLRIHLEQAQDLQAKIPGTD